MTEHMDDIDVDFQRKGYLPKEGFWTPGDEDETWVETTSKAKPSSAFLVNGKDLEEFSMQAQQRILSLERQLVSKKEEFFEIDEQKPTENLQG